MRRIVYLLAGTLFAGCGAEDTTLPSRNEIVGTYMGRYSHGAEKFVINDDNTFSQEFRTTLGIVYSSSGTWTNKGSSIEFHPFISPDGLWTGVKKGVPDGYNKGNGNWRRQPIRIMFFDAINYYVGKTAGVGATADPKNFEPVD